MMSLVEKNEFLDHEFHHCIEQENRYVLFIKWNTLEDYPKGFRAFGLFKEWRALIGPYFETPPQVQHFTMLLANPKG